jgi:hypothetical protein
VLLYRFRKPSWKLGDQTAAAAAPQTSAPARHTASRNRILAAVLIVLAVVGIVDYKQGRDDRLARSRADQVVSLYRAHDLTVPVSHETLTRTLGTDGGAVCDDPGAALSRALQDQQLVSGGTVGARPIRADRRVVEGERLILQVYCPRRLPAYERYVNSKRFYPVVRS